MTKNFFIQVMDNFKIKLKKRQEYVQKKKTLLKYLTIEESKLLYKTYINDKLTKIEKNLDKDIKDMEVKLTVKEIKRAIYWRLDVEQMTETIPRLKKFID